MDEAKKQAAQFGAIKKQLVERKLELEQELKQLLQEKFSDDQVQDAGDQALSSTMESLNTSLQHTKLEEYRRLEMALQMLEHFNHMRTFHTMLEMAFVNPARQRKAHGSRDTSPFALDASENRSLAARCPSAHQGFLKREPKFVKKHDFCAVAPRFF